jgi:DUF4097 and DUF4098 domain-containing protein YvlB
MSWLYSILFAGLLISSDGTGAASAPEVVEPEITVVAAEGQDFTEKFEQSYPLNSNGRVSISNVNGPIVIEAWDKTEVRLEATKVAESQEALNDVELKIDSTPGSFRVVADHKGWRFGNRTDRGRTTKLEVRFRLMVPSGAALNEIETVNGSVSVSNFVNFTKVSAVNGMVTATNLRGTVDLSTVNGEVRCDLDRLEPGSKISMSTVNGQVALVLPSDANATIRADSLNGNITNDFGLTVRKGEFVGRDLYGRLGSGDVQIKLNTVNGGLSIGRKKDGKTPSPATDLLQERSSTSVRTSEAAARAARANRAVAESAKVAADEVARAMKEAQAALEKARPELDKMKFEELEKLKIKIDPDVLKKSIDEGLRQAELAVRIRDANWITGAPGIEKQTNSFPVKGVPKVTIEAEGCNIRVRGWDQDEVKYVLTAMSLRPAERSVAVTDNIADSNITIKVVNEDSAPRSGFLWQRDTQLRLDVFVPRRSNLKITSNGEIHLNGVSGEIEMAGEDESVNVRDSEGKLTIATTSGQLRVLGFAGELNASTDVGNIFIEGDLKTLSAKTDEGRVVLTLPENSNATLLTNRNVVSEGISVVRENANTWKVGNGGNRFSFDLGDGDLTVRGSSTLDSH